MRVPSLSRPLSALRAGSTRGSQYLTNQIAKQSVLSFRMASTNSVSRLPISMRTACSICRLTLYQRIVWLKRRVTCPYTRLYQWPMGWRERWKYHQSYKWNQIQELLHIHTRADTYLNGRSCKPWRDWDSAWHGSYWDERGDWSSRSCIQDVEQDYRKGVPLYMMCCWSGTHSVLASARPPHEDACIDAWTCYRLSTHYCMSRLDMEVANCTHYLTTDTGEREAFDRSEGRPAFAIGSQINLICYW